MKTVTVDPYSVMMAAVMLFTALLWTFRAGTAVPENPKPPLTQTIYFEVLHMRCQATINGPLDSDMIEKLREMIRDPWRDRLVPGPSTMVPEPQPAEPEPAEPEPAEPPNADPEADPAAEPETPTRIAAAGPSD